MKRYKKAFPKKAKPETLVQGRQQATATLGGPQPNFCPISTFLNGCCRQAKARGTGQSAAWFTSQFPSPEKNAFAETGTAGARDGLGVEELETVSTDTCTRTVALAPTCRTEKAGKPSRSYKLSSRVRESRVPALYKT